MSAKKDKRFFLGNFGTYPFDILFTVGTSSQEIHDYIETNLKYKLNEEETTALTVEGKSGRSVMLKSGGCVLWAHTTNPGTVSHEAFHLMFFLMDRIGIKIDADNDEHGAYLVEYIVRQFYSHFKK